MKKIIISVLIAILCFGMLHVEAPGAQASAPKTPKAESTGEKDNKPTHDTKYTVKKIKKPPYCIAVNGSENSPFLPIYWDADCETQINILGQRDYDTIEGDWQFYVTLYKTYRGNSSWEEVAGGLQLNFSTEQSGVGKGELIDLIAQKKDKKKTKKTKWEMPGLDDEPKVKPEPIKVDRDIMKNIQDAPKELYKTEFDIEFSGTINLGPNMLTGEVGEGNDRQIITASELLPDKVEKNSTGKIELMVDSNNNVVASAKIDGKFYGPFVGFFTSEEDLQFQRKDSGKWPIWGVWTNVNPYEPFPNIEKDVKTITGQKGKNETPKKINYPEGKWVTLKQGNKDKPPIYATLQVSKDNIIYETGEIWTYPGSAMFKPEAKTVYSKDLQEILETYPISDYQQIITYHTISDTITYAGFGRLIRVRNAAILGLWSSSGSLGMPDIADPGVPDGTWYEFIGSPYTFTRMTVIDGNVEIDKGAATMYPVSDYEFLILSGITSDIIAPNGTKTGTGITKEDELVSVTEVNKNAGTIKFGAKEYTLIPGFKADGNWTTMEPPLGPPDVEKGAFKTRDEAGNPVDPPADAKWLQFDAKSKIFVLTQMLSEPSGILKETGNYRTFGKDVLLLSEIKGIFYPRPGSAAKGFSEKEYMYGERLLRIMQVTDEDNKPVSLTIAGIGVFRPIRPTE